MEISYDNLFAYMFKNNISKNEMSERTGVSRNTLIKMARGEPVHLSVLMAICEAYDLALSDVVQEKS